MVFDLEPTDNGKDEVLDPAPFVHLIQHDKAHIFLEVAVEEAHLDEDHRCDELEFRIDPTLRLLASRIANCLAYFATDQLRHALCDTMRGEATGLDNVYVLVVVDALANGLDQSC